MLIQNYHYNQPLGKQIYTPMHPRPSADTMSRCIDELNTLERLFWDSVRTSETYGHGMNGWMSHHNDDTNTRPYNTNSRNHRSSYSNHYNRSNHPSHSHSNLDKNSELGVYLESKHKQSIFSLDKNLNYHGCSSEGGYSSSSSSSSSRRRNIYGLDSVDDVNYMESNSRNMSTRGVNVNEIRSSPMKGGELRKFDMNLNAATDLLLSFANQSHDEVNIKRKNSDNVVTNNENEVKIDNKLEQRANDIEFENTMKYGNDKYDNQACSRKRLRINNEELDCYTNNYVNKEDVMHRVNSGEFSSHTSETSTESIGQRLEDGMDESTKGEKPINCYMNDSTTRSSGKNSIEFTMEFGDKMASSSSVNDHGAHTDCDETSI